MRIVAPLGKLVALDPEAKEPGAATLEVSVGDRTESPFVYILLDKGFRGQTPEVAKVVKLTPAHITTGQAEEIFLAMPPDESDRHDKRILLLDRLSHPLNQELKLGSILKEVRWHGQSEAVAFIALLQPGDYIMSPINGEWTVRWNDEGEYRQMSFSTLDMAASSQFRHIFDEEPV